MITTSLLLLFKRELAHLRNEVASFQSDESLWLKHEGISNPAGNLTLHLIGNLRHFIGHVIGKSTYVRKREKEFTTPFVKRSELLVLIDACELELTEAMQTLSEDDLSKVYPIQVFCTPMTYGYFLQHLYGHFLYHLGQINYYRKLA